MLRTKKLMLDLCRFTLKERCKKMNPARHQRRAGFGSQTKNVFMRRFLSVLFGQVSLLGLQGRCGHHGIVVSEL